MAKCSAKLGLIGLWGLIWSLIGLLASPAFAAGPVYLMGAIGDSISAAFIADTGLATTSSLYSEQLLANPELPEAFTEALDENTVEQIGSNGLFEHKYEYSWSTGQDIRSHVQKLRRFLQRRDPQADLETFNTAKTRTHAVDMPRQAQAFVEKFKSGNYKAVKYVTFLIGANDVCAPDAPTDDKLMRGYILEALQTLTQIHQSEPIRVLMVGLPRMPDLSLPEVRDATTWFLGLSCHFVRDVVLKRCDRMLGWNTPEEYQAAVQVVVDKNKLIERTAKEASRMFAPHLQVHYSGKLWQQHFGPADLALDCMHPNKLGQQGLSDLLWNEQPWYN